MTMTERRSLYPPGHQQSDDPYYLDDTLDAYPPYHLLRAKPTPESMAAAQQLAAKHGYPMPHLPPETNGSPDAPTAAAAVNGAIAERPKKNAASSRAKAQ